MKISMDKYQRLVILNILLMAVLILSSCSNGTEELVIMPLTEPTKFYPLKEVNAELDCVSPRRSFYTDEDIKLTFRLTNFSTKPLLIYEWMRKQENNIKIRFHVCVEGDKVPPVSQWKVIEPLLGPPPIARQSIELTTRSSTLIDKTIRLSELGLQKNKLAEEQIVLIVAELNLQSLRLCSDLVKVQIRKRATVIDE